jgi:hypothetical protein
MKSHLSTSEFGLLGDCSCTTPGPVAPLGSDREKIRFAELHAAVRVPDANSVIEATRSKPSHYQDVVNWYAPDSDSMGAQATSAFQGDLFTLPT